MNLIIMILHNNIKDLLTLNKTIMVLRLEILKIDNMTTYKCITNNII